ncbi:MAG: carbon-nitrogen hydrolase family protein, partial [Candidatus Gagatemarchaeaceae archaeon]
MNDEPKKFRRDWAALVEHVGRQSSELVLLPEMPFHYWFAAEKKYDEKIWEETVTDHEKWMKRLSELGVPVVLGSRAVNIRGKRLNQGFVWTPHGGAKGVHLKSYLPDEGGFYEASWYHRGDRSFKPFRAGRVRAGFMICSDLWSMASARVYGKKRVELIAVPRATPKPTTEKWLAGGR